MHTPTTRPTTAPRARNAARLLLTLGLVAAVAAPGSTARAAGPGADEDGAAEAKTTAAAKGDPNWPDWRGPRGNGTTGAVDVPLEWSAEKGVLWRTPLPGPAGATPVVWGSRIWLTSATDGEALVLLCLAAKDGEELWRREIGRGNKAVRGDEGNSASPSPVTDGEHVWSLTGGGRLACFTPDGDTTWEVDLQKEYGEYDFWFGMTSSPLLVGDALFIQCLQMESPYVLALDKATGKKRWKVTRDSNADFESRHSYASPTLYEDDSRRWLLVHGGDYLTAHALDDGRELWRVGDLNPPDRYNRTLRFVASPVSVPGLIVAPSAKNGPVLGLRPADGAEGAPGVERAWTRGSNTPDVPTPVIHDGLVYLMRESGVMICVDAKTGEEVYEERVHRDRHRASPIVAADRIYCAARDGTINVLRAGREFEVLASNALGEPVASSPVIVDGRIYVRTFESLIAIGAR